MHRSMVGWFSCNYSRIFTASLERTKPRPDQSIIIATMNLFSVMSADQDQFRHPRQSKKGTSDSRGKEGGRERESLAEEPRQRFRGLQGVRVKNRGPSGRSGEGP